MGLIVLVVVLAVLAVVAVAAYAIDGSVPEEDGDDVPLTRRDPAGTPVTGTSTF